MRNGGGREVYKLTNQRLLKEHPLINPGNSVPETNFWIRCVVLSDAMSLPPGPART
jgi:hypothetical protein